MGEWGPDSKSKQVKRTIKLITIEDKKQHGLCGQNAISWHGGTRMEERWRLKKGEKKKRKEHKSWTGLIGSMRVSM